MMSERTLGERRLYICDECGLGYMDRETAVACEAHCKKCKACSLEITRKAVYYP